MSAYLLNFLRNLLIICVSMFLISLMFLIIQSATGRYFNPVTHVNEAKFAFFWLTKHAVPYIFLLGIGYVQIKKIENIEKVKTDRLLVRVLRVITIIYFFALLAFLLSQPLLPANPDGPIKKLEGPDIGLFIFQGLLGVLLVIAAWRLKKYLLMQDSALVEPRKPVVFISYNHADKKVADNLMQMIEKKKVDVILDSSDMEAGESINSFIIDCINKSTVTLSIVSQNSLLSGYVSMETISTMYSEMFGGKRKFIACYLDESFMQADFTIRAVQIIDQRLEDIRVKMDTQDDLGIDTLNLNNQKTRLISMRQNLDTVIDRLNRSLCIDIREDKLAENFPRLMESIKEVM